MLEWAEIELGCREAPAPEELQAESDLSPASEIDSEAIVEVELADADENTEILASISETDTDPSEDNLKCPVEFGQKARLAKEVLSFLKFLTRKPLA